MMSTRPPTDPIPAPPAEVVDRLRSQLFGVRSVWFPSRNDLRDWEQAPQPLYIRWLDQRRFEIGPRLESMWAACFSPVWQGEISGSGDETVITWNRWYPTFTLVLLFVWTLLIGLWGAVLWSAVSAGREEPGMLFFWALLAGGAALAAAVGTVMGGGRLGAAMPWLTEAITKAPVDEDW